MNKTINFFIFFCTLFFSHSLFCSYTKEISQLGMDGLYVAGILTCAYVGYKKTANEPMKAFNFLNPLAQKLSLQLNTNPEYIKLVMLSWLVAISIGPFCAKNNNNLIDYYYESFFSCVYPLGSGIVAAKIKQIAAQNEENERICTLL